jgi:hypothetical protein
MEKRQMTEQARIAELEAELAALKGPVVGLTVKFGNKRNVVVGGKALGQRFPVTLYAQGWKALLQPENVKMILDFIEDNKEGLDWK